MCKIVELVTECRGVEIEFKECEIISAQEQSYTAQLDIDVVPLLMIQEDSYCLKSVIVVAPCHTMQRVLSFLRSQLSFFEPRLEVLRISRWKGKFLEDGQTLQAYSIHGHKKPMCFLGVDTIADSILTLLLQPRFPSEDVIEATPHNYDMPIITGGRYI